MKKILISLFLTLFLFLQLNAQMISKWNMVIDGKKLSEKILADEWERTLLPSFYPSGLTVFNKNHFCFVSDYVASPSYRTYPMHIAIFINDKDTNVLKLRAFDVSSGFLIKNLHYLDSTTIFCLVDSSYFAYTDGINLFYRYISFVYKSTDGGKNWTVYPTQENLSLRKRPSLFLRMTDSLHGILVQLPDTLENYDRILLTTDGWKTYKEVKTNKFYLSSKGFYSPPFIAVFTRANEFWVSKDNGNTWDTLSFPEFNKRVKDVYFVSDSLWFFSGYSKASNSKILLRTSDKGIHWDTLLKLQSVDPSDTLQLSIFPPFDDKHITTIINKKYAFTENFGTSWKYITPMVYHDGVEFVVLLSYYDGKIGYGISVLPEGLVYRGVEMYTGDSILAPPKFVEPKGYYKIPMDFTIKWTNVEGADSYRLQIAEGPGVDFEKPEMPLPSFETDLIIDTSLTDTTFQMKNTKYYRTYYCRILAKNEKYTSAWVSKYFVTINQPNSVVEPIPISKPSLIIQKHKLNDEEKFLYEMLYRSTLYNIFGVAICNACNESDIKKLPSGVYFLRNNKQFIKILVLE